MVFHLRIYKNQDVFFLNETNSLSLHKIFLMAEDINRLRLILVEKKNTSKWLADELGVWRK